MKISIDTKEDSHEDIRKVIKMLQHLVNEEAYSNYQSSNSGNMFSDNKPEAAPSSEGISVFGAMFGNDAPVTNTVPLAPQPTVNSSEEIRKKIRFEMDNEIVPY
jgi:hypothetical protein